MNLLQFFKLDDWLPSQPQTNVMMNCSLVQLRRA
jgi:hypothetical protein